MDGDNSNSIKYDNKNSNELSSITLVNVCWEIIIIWQMIRHISLIFFIY